MSTPSVMMAPGPDSSATPPPAACVWTSDANALVSRSTLSSTSSSNTRRTGSGVLCLRILRCWLLDVPLALVLGAFLVVSMGRRLYHTYYDPLLFDRARRTNDDLHDEYTYYHRECTHYDLTTNSNTFLNDLNILDTPTTSRDSTTSSVQQVMLTHGAMVIPNILSNSSRAALREYIVRRNAEISSAEQYPVSQGYNRISYGIDATEHAAVTNAISEITANPLLQSTLQQLLGDVDPASAEITAITGYAGCPDQAWHPDTKTDGNALKFARTYSHSYSLFVALQDITHTMGATDLCPGTHYCANNLETLCENHKVRLATTTTTTSNTSTTTTSTASTSFWKAGDAALLNQHVWHRGSAHRDRNAPERILFILSFLARPQFGTTDDTRQLSRGTYFHQKWNMWGHTYQDLLQPLATMKKPWSILRCLSLWKPSPDKHNWGYDLVTAVFLRFSNNQLENEDLSERWIGRLDQLGFPSWLRGRVVLYRGEHDLDDDDEDGYDDEDALTQRESWTIFLRETFDKMVTFAQLVYLAALATYILLVLLAAAAVVAFSSSSSSRATTTTATTTTTTKQSKNPRVIILRATRRLLLSHAIVAGLVWYIWHGIETSPWATNIRNGKTLMRPFPPLPPMPFSLIPYSSFSDVSLVATSPDDNVDFHGGNSNKNGAAGELVVSSTIITTTWPQRNDVLLGTRYSAKFLGSYDRWLDYHPGNVAFWNLIAQQVAPYYHYSHDDSHQQHQQQQQHDPSSFSTAATTTTTTFSLTPWQQTLLEYVRREISRANGGGGRLLHQDYRTGDWKLFASPQEELWAIHQQVVAASHPALWAIRRELDHAMAHCRFGVIRGTPLAQLALRQLGRLQKQIFFSHKTTNNNKAPSSTISQSSRMILSLPATSTTSSSNRISSFTPRKWSLPLLLSKNSNAVSSSRPKSGSVSYDSRTTLPVEQEKPLRPGTSVNVFYPKDGLYYPAVIMSIDYDKSIASVSYTNGDDEHYVALTRMAVRRPIVQGSPVVGCYSGIHSSDDDCFPGKIARVHASGAALIEFEDGEIDWRQPWDYYVPPFRTFINPEES